MYHKLFFKFVKILTAQTACQILFDFAWFINHNNY